MNKSAAIQLLLILITLNLIHPIQCVAQKGLDANTQDAMLEFKEEPIEKVCKSIADEYDIPVFLQKGIRVKLSSDEIHTKLSKDLRRMLKPHGLHLHVDFLGMFITRKNIPDNVTHLLGDVQIELAIPNGRVQKLANDFTVKWPSGNSTIYARGQKVGNKSLSQAVEDKIAFHRELYKFTNEPVVIKKDGKSYFAFKMPVPAKVTHEGKVKKFPWKEDMVSDEIYFLNGDYWYTITHFYPKSASREGAKISKRLLDTISWKPMPKYQSFGR